MFVCKWLFLFPYLCSPCLHFSLSSITVLPPLPSSSLFVSSSSSYHLPPPPSLSLLSLQRDVLADTTHYSFDNLLPAHTYYFSLVADVSSHLSIHSALVNATTPAGRQWMGRGEGRRREPEEGRGRRGKGGGGREGLVGREVGGEVGGREEGEGRGDGKWWEVKGRDKKEEKEKKEVS